MTKQDLLDQDSKIIILTGMDNTGKTTLAQEISEFKDRPLVKSMGPGTKDQQIDWVLKQVADLMFKYPEGIIYDRFTCLEDMIYGPVLRGRSNFTLEDPIIKILKSFDPIIIYTRIPKDMIMNFGDREQYPGVIEKAERLLLQFDDLIGKLMSQGWNVQLYDYTHKLYK